jgi:hypothetical protein
MWHEENGPRWMRVRPIWKAWLKALDRGETIVITPEQAEFALTASPADPLCMAARYVCEHGGRVIVDARVEQIEGTISFTPP